MQEPIEIHTNLGRGPDKDVQANEAAMQAVKKIHELDIELKRNFDNLERNREILREHGIVFDPHFSEMIEAAFSNYRGEPFWERMPE